VFPTVRYAIARANRFPDRFRVVRFSVQANHIHLVVEADDRRALLSGVRSFAIGFARSFNRLLGRRGSVFSDRWHGRALSSPRSVRNALRYVLTNAQKHGELPRGVRDPLSSATLVTSLARAGPARAAPLPVVPAQSWLLGAGLGHGGPLELD
jgi:putative transposase